MNLSNHPSDAWSDEQMRSARALDPDAELIDLPFPHVDPALSTQEVIDLAEQEWTRIMSELTHHHQRPLHAMISGETIFCVALVRKLQDAGITCYCATTKRVSETDAQGVKSSIFTFVKFREWPKPL